MKGLHCSNFITCTAISFQITPKNEPGFLDSFDAIKKLMSNNPASEVLIDTTSDSRIVSQQMTYHNSIHCALAL